MKKKIINPWTWQEERGYVQAVEVKNFEAILYCAGQAAVLPDGASSEKDMKTQMLRALGNLEEVISQAGYACKNIVRLNVFTTSSKEFVENCFDLYKQGVRKHSVTTAVTLVEVNGLYETLSIEFEATVVK